MKQTVPSERPLGMTESYHAAQCWLTHIGQPTTKIEEPTGDIVEMQTVSYLARVRVSKEATGQGAVIGLMRSGSVHEDLELLMFSPTGYNTAAEEFADLRNIALFSLTSTGDVRPVTAAARGVMTTEPFEPPFLPLEEAEEEFVLPPLPEPEAADEPDDTSEASELDWRKCPQCGAGHHPDVIRCTQCDADLTSRLTLLGDSSGHSIGSLLSPHNPRAPRHGTSTLRCRSCGSHDIDLVRN